jgi:ATP-dependent Clp protease ATP-binding subunit ClpA
VDCAEFQHSHEIAKLIGSPPGYLGHRETHPMLSQEALNQFHTDKVKLSFVLFDEIEKASDALWNLLLGILDKATLTLGDNRRVDFSRALIFMTSNLGACETESMLRPRFGFRGPVSDDVKLDSRLASTGVEAARRKFTPEFMNRIDKVVTFRTLGKEQLRQILDIELGMVQQRIFDSSKAPPFVFSLTDPAKQFLLTEGTDLRYGARHLKRAIERNLVQPLSNLLATEQIVSDDMIRVDLDCRLSCLTFTKVAEDVPSYAMAQLAGVQNPSAAARAASGLPVEVIRTANPRQSRRP